MVVLTVKKELLTSQGASTPSIQEIEREMLFAQLAALQAMKAESEEERVKEIKEEIRQQYADMKSDSSEIEKIKGVVKLTVKQMDHPITFRWQGQFFKIARPSNAFKKSEVGKQQDPIIVSPFKIQIPGNDLSKYKLHEINSVENKPRWLGKNAINASKDILGIADSGNPQDSDDCPYAFTVKDSGRSYTCTHQGDENETSIIGYTHESEQAIDIEEIYKDMFFQQVKEQCLVHGLEPDKYITACYNGEKVTKLPGMNFDIDTVENYRGQAEGVIRALAMTYFSGASINNKLVNSHKLTASTLLNKQNEKENQAATTIQRATRGFQAKGKKAELKKEKARNKKISEIERKLNESRDNQKSLEEKIKELEAEKKRNEREKNKQIRENSRLKREKEGLRKSYDSLENLYYSLKDELNDYHEKLESQKSSETTKREEVDKVTKKNQKLQTEIKKLIVNLEKEKIKVAEVELKYKKKEGKLKTAVDKLHKEVEKANSDVKSKDAKIKQLIGKNETQSKKINELKQEEQKEIVRIQSQLEGAELKAKALEVKLEKKKQEIDDANKRADKSEGNAIRLNEELKKANEDKRNAEKKLKAAKEEILQVNDDASLTAEKAAVLDEKLKKLTEEIKISNVNKTISRARDVVSRISKGVYGGEKINESFEKVDLRKEASCYEECNDGVKELIANIKKQFIHLDGRLNDIETSTECQKILGELRALKAVSDTNQLGVVNCTPTAHKKRMNKFKKKRDSLVRREEKEKHEEEEKINNLKKSLEVEKEQVSVLKQEMNAQGEKYSRDLKAQKEEHSMALHKAEKQANTAASNAKQSEVRLREKVGGLENNLKQEKERREKEKCDATKTVDEIKVKFGSLKIRLNEAEGSLLEEQLVTKMQKAVHVNEIKKMKAEAQKEIDGLTENVSKANERTTAVENRLAVAKKEHESKVSELTVKLNSATEKEEMIKKSFENSNEKLSVACQENRILKKELKEKLENDKNKEKENAASLRKLMEANKKLAVDNLRLSESNAKLEKTVEGASELFSSVAVAQLDAECSEVKSRLAVSKADKIVKENQKQIKDLSHDLIAVREKLSISNGDNQRLSDENGLLKKGNVELEKLNKNNLELISNHKSDNEELLQSLKVLKEQYLEKVKILNAEMKVFESKVASQEKELESLKKRYATKQDELKSVTDDNKSKGVSLLQQQQIAGGLKLDLVASYGELEKRNTECKKLRSSMDASNRALLDSEKRVEMLNAKLVFSEREVTSENHKLIQLTAEMNLLRAAHKEEKNNLEDEFQRQLVDGENKIKRLEANQQSRAGKSESGDQVSKLYIQNNQLRKKLEKLRSELDLSNNSVVLPKERGIDVKKAQMDHVGVGDAHQVLINQYEKTISELKSKVIKLDVQLAEERVHYQQSYSTKSAELEVALDEVEDGKVIISELNDKLKILETSQKNSTRIGSHPRGQMRKYSANAAAHAAAYAKEEALYNKFESKIFRWLKKNPGSRQTFVKTFLASTPGKDGAVKRALASIPSSRGVSNDNLKLESILQNPVKFKKQINQMPLLKKQLLDKYCEANRKSTPDGSLVPRVVSSRSSIWFLLLFSLGIVSGVLYFSFA